MDKKQLRKDMLAVRAALSAMERKHQDQAILGGILNSEWYKNCECLLTYVSFGDEADTRRLLMYALADGKKVFCPKVFTQSRTMQFYRIYGMEDLRPGCMGIPEPEEASERMFTAHTGCMGRDLAVIPGLAFDCRHGRIGYGGGYYDRFLADMAHRRTGMVSAAIGYRQQLLPEGMIPMEDTDMRPDILVIPKERERNGL